MTPDYLESVKKQFAYYKHLADASIARVTDDSLFWQYNQESNSMAIIMNHMAGNMLSRWTDFLTTDGEKEWRNREQEFENNTSGKTELLAHWESGWKCLFDALDTLTTEDLGKKVYIRNMEHSVADAINRQLAHYPYHVGQLVFLGKMICNTSWISLSIPRGNSNTFNAEKFAQPKHKEHFTDEFLKKKSE
jgi:hypothetical protein